MKFEGIKGLSEKDVEASRRNNGTNELPPAAEEGFWDKLKENFEDPLIRILLVALGVTLALAFIGYADWVEGFGIAIAVFLATFVSTYSEYKNESSFRQLQEQASRAENNVFRNGNLTKIFASEIVVGDMVLLQAGDKIPADGLLVQGDLQVNQATLTGEQQSVRKKVAPKNYEFKENSDPLEEEMVCFRGTVVDDGEAVLRVEAVGTHTTYGQLFEQLSDREERETPLQVKLNNLADGVATFGYVGATAIAISFLFKQFILDNHYDWEIIRNYVSFANWHQALNDVVTSVILAIIVVVVAVPEGLPMMIAIVLSLNMRKLLKSKVLVRKLLGIETAGSLDILFVDKTGTLTKGIFIPEVFISGNLDDYQSFTEIPTTLRAILAFSLRESTSAVLEKDGPVGGNASDRALLSFLYQEHLNERVPVSVVNEILFNSERKFSAVQLKFNGSSGKPNYLQQSGKDNFLTVVKGAPEIILSSCRYYYTPEGKQDKIHSIEPITNKINEYSQRGIRVIAIATSDAVLEEGKAPSNLCLVGIMGIVDEIRKESKPAIELARSAGIHVVMITGDRKETATAVANEIGLLDDNQAVLTSQHLKGMTDEQLQRRIMEIGVIARALPTDKSRLVTVCQQLNKVVGMTGDGVNDSAALKMADVGFAMGGGSEVAKEASDIVILDDNFQSITQAILYGRTIFKSIRKFIVFQSTVNCASLLIVFLGPFLGFDFPLTLIQLLWVNLVMDTLAAMAFGGEPALVRYMYEKPIKRDEPIISTQMWSSILINGMFIAALCIIALIYPPIRELFVRDGKPNEAVFLTAFFAFFIFLTNFNSFNARTPKINIFDHIFENSGFVWVVLLIFVVQVTFTYLGGKILRTVGLTFHEWVMVIGVSSIIIPFDMVRKMVISSITQSRSTTPATNLHHN